MSDTRHRSFFALVTAVAMIALLTYFIYLYLDHKAVSEDNTPLQATPTTIENFNTWVGAASIVQYLVDNMDNDDLPALCNLSFDEAMNLTSALDLDLDGMRASLVSSLKNELLSLIPDCKTQCSCGYIGEVFIEQLSDAYQTVLTEGELILLEEANHKAKSITNDDLAKCALSASQRSDVCQLLQSFY